MTRMKFDAISLYHRHIYNHEILDRLSEYKDMLFRDNVEDFLIDTPDGRTSFSKLDNYPLFFLDDGMYGSYTANMHCREALTRRIILGNSQLNPLKYNSQCVTLIYLRLPKNRVFYTEESGLAKDSVEIDPNSLRYYIEEFVDKTSYRDEEGDLGPLEDLERWINIREFNIERKQRTANDIITTWDEHYEVVFPVFYDYMKQGIFYRLFPSMLIYWLRHGRSVFTDSGKRYKWDNMMSNFKSKQALTLEYFWMAVFSSGSLLNTYSLEHLNAEDANGPQSYFAKGVNLLRDTAFLARLFDARALQNYISPEGVTSVGMKSNNNLISERLIHDRYRGLFSEIANNMRQPNE